MQNIVFNSILSLALVLVLYIDARAQAIPVEIQLTVSGSDTSYTLLRGGEPFFAKGGCEFNFPDRMAEAGGNSIRTYNINEETLGKIAQAHGLGLTILLGLPMNNAANFDYSDTARVNNLINNLRTWVNTYKNSEGLLAWCIGNEIEVGNTDDKVWEVVNQIAQMIHQEDGNHPTMVATAGISRDKADKIAALCPDLDIIGVNVYAQLPGVPQIFENSKWRKPYMVTEWGVTAPYESARTFWDAPIELNSTEKAAVIRDRYDNVILTDSDRCLGSYVFIWSSSKNEGSATWFPLFVKDNDSESVDEMQFVWSGSYPSNRAPNMVGQASLNDQFRNDEVIIISPFDNKMTIDAIDPDGDSIDFEFIVRPSTGNEGTVPGKLLDEIPDLITSQEGGTVTFYVTREMNLKNYRIYGFAKDGNKNVASANIPFRVELEPGTIIVDNELPAIQDTYVRDGFYEDKRLGSNDPFRLQTKFSPIEGYNRETYLSFATKNLEDDFGSVKLLVYGGGAAGVDLQLFGFKNLSWNDLELTWEGRLSEDSLNYLRAITTETDELQYYEWNVTSYIRNAIQNGDSTISFVIKSTTDYVGDAIFWNPRENVFDPPKLVFSDEVITSISQRENDLQIKPFPNPAGNRINLKFSNHQGVKDFRVQLTTIDGKVIKSAAVNFNALPDQVFSWSVDELPSGMYLIQSSLEGDTLPPVKIFKR